MYRPSRIARGTDASRRCLSAALVKPHHAGDAYSSFERTTALRYVVTRIPVKCCLQYFSHCWLGDRKGIRPVKNEWWGAGVVICLELGADLLAYGPADTTAIHCLLLQ